MKTEIGGQMPREPGDYVAMRPVDDLTHLLARSGGYRC